MTHGSLFSGIGGFDLAAEWMGWQNKFHCEWNEFGQKVLHHYWPEAKQYTDITKSSFYEWRGHIDILTGGFPCQPYSSAGKRLGKEDERHLWPHMLRAIGEIAPRYIVGENVRGLTNWNGGMVFDEVCAEMEALGYQVAPFLIPACGVNAPHRRERIWFVAHATCTSEGTNEFRGVRPTDGTTYGERTQTFHDAVGSDGSKGTPPHHDSNGQHAGHSQYEKQPGEGWQYAQRDTQQGDEYGDATDAKRIGSQIRSEAGNISGKKRKASSQGCKSTISIETNGSGHRFDDAADTSNKGLQGSKVRGIIEGSREYSHKLFTGCVRTTWSNFPSVSPICSRNDGLSNRLDGITFSKWRQESIKAAGNAVVPQIVLQIFKAIQEYENKFGK